jgi:BirA family transcriptional regulator, biotin operon repressor / biotin---[acetyl-CoA-carboxylase] ligase
VGRDCRTADPRGVGCRQTPRSNPSDQLRAPARPNALSAAIETATVNALSAAIETATVNLPRRRAIASVMIDQFTVWHHDRIGSTNDEAHRMANEGAPHGTVVHADEQIAGRGRLAHTWFSPPGNLYLSILLRTGQPASRTAELSFLAALAVADTVEALLPRQIRAMLKWPNDVLVNGGKIAGILLEQVGDATVMGIGLNVLEAPANAAYKATTIVANGGIASVDGTRDILLGRLGLHLTEWQADGFAPIREQWLSRSYPIGAAIRANADGQPIAGHFAGLDLDGALLLDTLNGRQRIVAGDVVTIAG